MEKDLELKNVTEKSKEIVRMFLEYYTSTKQYGSVIKEIAENFSGSFESINTEVYLKIIENYHNQHSKKIYADTFFKFLYAYELFEPEVEIEYANIFGRKDKLIKKFEDQKEKSKNSKMMEKEKKGSIYSFQDIEKLQEYCKDVESAIDFESYGKLKNAFAFYLLFYLGIPKEAFMQCKMSDYHDGMLFIDGKNIEVPESYQSVFSYAKKANKDTRFAEVNNWITKLGKELNIENLTPKRILMARRDYLFTCPICREQHLSFSENWSVINGKIVCSKCSNELLKNGVKKNSKTELKSFDVDILEDDEKRKIKSNVASYVRLNDELRGICNFEALNRYLKMIGKIGEKYVYSLEVKKLLDAGKENLAERVDASVALDNRNGFDILSFDEKGRKRYIEVKSTAGDFDEPFYMSKNELEKAEEIKKQGEQYIIYRVYNVGKDNIAHKIVDDISKYAREDVVYKMILEK